MEKPSVVDQKATTRFDAIRAFILAYREEFRRQGSVVAGWRTYRGRRLGPFFTLRYRKGGRQAALYLGRSGSLAAQVRELLAEVQRPRLLRRCIQQARAEVRRCKRAWQEDLAAVGLSLKGCEVRGWRGLSPTSGPLAATFEASKEER